MYSQYEDRYVAELEEDLKSLRTQLAKANERVRELEQNQLPIENGENRYGLDVSYFRNVINRELNRSLDNYKPDELARVLARISRTADKSVMFEPEFSNKFAIENKCEGINDFMHHFRYEYEGARDTDSIESFADDLVEQLRKEQASE